MSWNGFSNVGIFFNVLVLYFVYEKFVEDYVLGDMRDKYVHHYVF